MDPIHRFMTLPAELEIWLIFSYVVIILLGARAVEIVAKMHFHRARRFAEHGFEYVADDDHYLCPEGERLHLHLVDSSQRLAIYRAPASSCNDCELKSHCTPHDEGRHMYRSLAEWAETDVARFHRRMSLVMFAVGVVMSAIGLVRWGRQPGTGLLLLGFVLSLGCTIHNAWTTVRESSAGRDAPPTSHEG